MAEMIKLETVGHRAVLLLPIPDMRGLNSSVTPEATVAIPERLGEHPAASLRIYQIVGFRRVAVTCKIVMRLAFTWAFIPELRLVPATTFAQADQMHATGG